MPEYEVQIEVNFSGNILEYFDAETYEEAESEAKAKFNGMSDQELIDLSGGCFELDYDIAEVSTQ